MVGEPGAEDELALAERFARDGDRRAFEALVRLRLPSIRRYLALRLPDPAEAAEAEQDVLVRLFTSLGGFRGESSLSTWIWRVCAAAAADLVRAKARERRKARRLLLVAGEGFRASDGAGWELERSESAAALRRALAALGEPDASLLYLRDAEGLPVEELSRAFGLPAGTVKSKLARSRAKARAFLEAEEGAASRRGA